MNHRSMTSAQKSASTKITRAFFNFLKPHWIPLKIRFMGLSLSTNLWSCHRNFPAAKRYPFKRTPLSSLSPTSGHSLLRWNDKMYQYLMSPKEKVSAIGGDSMSKGKVRRIMESKEPIFQDRVVHEVMLMILEPFFEARFSSKSHGFRPGRNPHTVIRIVRSNFAGYLWFTKGDVSEMLMLML